jgi:hypothetical protein
MVSGSSSANSQLDVFDRPVATGLDASYFIDALT